MADPNSPTWHIAIAEPNRDAIAAAALASLGLPTVWLRYWLTSHRGITVSRLVPYLPPYLFAALTPNQPISTITTARGVASLLAVAGEPYRLPATILWQLRADFDPAGIAPPTPRTLRHLRHALRHLPQDARDNLIAAIDRLDDRGRFRLRSGPDSAWMFPPVKVGLHPVPTQHRGPPGTP